MKKRFLAALIVSLGMLVACDDSSSASSENDKELSSSSTEKSGNSKDKSSSSEAKSSDSKAESSSSKKEVKGEYKREFATAIASGETMFIGTMSLDHTDDIGTDYIEVGTRAGVVYYDNSLLLYCIGKLCTVGGSARLAHNAGLTVKVVLVLSDSYAKMV